MTSPIDAVLWFWFETRSSQQSVKDVFRHEWSGVQEEDTITSKLEVLCDVWSNGWSAGYVLSLRGVSGGSDGSHCVES